MLSARFEGYYFITECWRILRVIRFFQHLQISDIISYNTNVIMTETQFLQQTSVEAWILNRSDVAVKANFNMTVQTHFNEYAPLAYE